MRSKSEAASLHRELQGLRKMSVQDKKPKYQTRQIMRALALFAIFVSLYWYLQPLASKSSRLVYLDSRPEYRSEEFDWNSIKASSSLEYVPCYTEKNPKLQCAKLIVPLDPVKASETRTISLAVIRLPAPVDVVSKRYGGAFIINSGGPGESGIDFTLFGGEKCQAFVSNTTGLNHDRDSATSVDEEGGLVYDIISFDARGIGRSEPSFHIFHTAKASFEWDIEKRVAGAELQHDTVLQAYRASSEAYGKALRRAFDDERNSDIGRYIGTTSVVRDLLGLTDAHGKWRQREAEKVLRSKPHAKLSTQQKKVVISRTKYRGEGREKLNFWGISYGTFMGQMFASLYPDRYDRLIADAVVSPTRLLEPERDITSGDLDNITRRFAEECYLAGPNKCHLFSEDGPKGTLRTFYGFLEKLRQNGPVTEVVDDSPVSVSISEVTRYMLTAWYHSKAEFPVVDRNIWSAMHRNLTGLVRARSTSSYNPSDGDEKFLLKNDNDLEAAIDCIDIPPRVWNDYEKPEIIKRLVDAFFEESEYIGGSSFRSSGRLHCAQLRDIDLPEHLRFEGPWGFRSVDAHPVEAQHETNTIQSPSKPSPILFLSNHHDPVTRLKFAREARALFPGSGLVVNDVPGHAQIHWPSSCVIEKVQRYASTGEVDAEEEVWCPQEGHPAWEDI